MALLATAIAFTLGCAPNGEPSAVVGIVIHDSCDPGVELGSGALVAPGLVLTSAHVVAGATTIEVVRDSQSVLGRIVGFDPNMDLAYVAVEGISGLPFSVSSGGVDAGAEGVAYVVRDGIVVELPVTVLRRITIRTEDVYSEGDTLRPGFELDGDVQLGDSGAAVVIDGKLVGVVWARSRQTEDRSWAIDPDRAGDLIDEQLSTGKFDADIDLTRCR